MSPWGGHTMSTVHGTLRADRRTKNLVKRLHPGDIAFINHADIDATAARALADTRVAAVVNAAASCTGRYPNQGPKVLVDAGVPLLDAIGDAAFERALSFEGQQAVVVGNVLRLPDNDCTQGELLTPAIVAQKLEAARANISRELDAFAGTRSSTCRKKRAYCSIRSTCRKCGLR